MVQMLSKVSPYIIWYVFGPHVGEFEPNRMVQNVKKKNELFRQKTEFFKHFWRSVAVILQEVSAAESIV